MLHALRLPVAALAACAAFLPLPAAAWGGITTGRIIQMDVSNAGNLPFRVALENYPVLCEGGTAEGYLDDSDANYKVYVAALMMAKATGATVTLYADLGAFGRCRIGYVSIR
jgi:hypothetical protein